MVGTLISKNKRQSALPDVRKDLEQHSTSKPRRDAQLMQILQLKIQHTENKLPKFEDIKCNGVIIKKKSYIQLPPRAETARRVANADTKETGFKCSALAQNDPRQIMVKGNPPVRGVTNMRKCTARGKMPISEVDRGPPYVERATLTTPWPQF